MRSFPRTVVSTFGLAILLIAGPAHCSPTSEQANKADDPKIMELRSSFRLGIMICFPMGLQKPAPCRFPL